jgi:hypothetical protein
VSEGLSLMDELKESIMEDEAKQLGLVDHDLDDSYRILDVSGANFFLKRLEELTAEETEINSMCDDEVEKYTERVNKFRDEKLKTILNTKAYFKKLLERYAEGELSGSNKKSIKLPFGTLQFRKVASQYSYEDEKLLKYLKDNKLTTYISIKETPNKAELKKAADARDGKLYIEDKEVDGVIVSDGSTSFDVKLNQ